jgi:hypothetical protein
MRSKQFLFLVLSFLHLIYISQSSEVYGIPSIKTKMEESSCPCSLKDSCCDASLPSDPCTSGCCVFSTSVLNLNFQNAEQSSIKGSIKKNAGRLSSSIIAANSLTDLINWQWVLPSLISSKVSRWIELHQTRQFLLQFFAVWRC